MKREHLLPLIKPHLESHFMGMDKEQLVQLLIECMSRKDLEQTWKEIQTRKQS